MDELKLVFVFIANRVRYCRCFAYLANESRELTAVQAETTVHTNRREDPGRYSREVWGSDGLGLISHLILIRIL